jgi:pimeloyl-ACP methyl ester carboxylesterase
MPTATVQLVPDAGHQLPLTHPEAAVAAVRGMALRIARHGN